MLRSKIIYGIIFIFLFANPTQAYTGTASMDTLNVDDLNATQLIAHLDANNKDITGIDEIEADDWTDVDITLSQISDYSAFDSTPQDNNITHLWGNLTDVPAQPNIDGANVTSGTIAAARIHGDMATDAELALQDSCSEITGCVENALVAADRAVQPSIDGANVTAGTIAVARMHSDMATDTELAAQDSCAEITGCVESAITATLTQEEVDDYVALLLNDADSVHTGITITYDDANDAYDFEVTSVGASQPNIDYANITSGSFNVQPSIDGANVTSGTIAVARMHADMSTDSERTTGLAAQDACSEITGCVENALVAADRAVQPSIDGANVTAGTIAVARMHSDMATDTELAAQDSCAEITGCVESAITATLTQEEVDDYVNALLNDADSVHTGITITYDDVNDAYDFEVTATGASQPNIDGANVTSGTIAVARMHGDMATDAELAAQDDCSEITGCVENALVAADRAVKPNIDGENITAGTIAVARMHGDMATDTELAAQDSCAEITGCVESAITATLTQEEVDDYVALLLNDADSVHTGITITYDDANDAYDFEVTATGASQPNIDGANVTSGTIAAARIHTDMATDAELAAQDACSEITGCVENALVAADRAVQPSIDGANVTAGTIAAARIHTDMATDAELALQDACSEITGCVEGAITATLTQEEVDDYVNALLNDGDSVHTGITITYDDANDAYDFEVTATGASQPNIDGANVTSGTIAAARIHGDIATDAELALQDSCSEITGCVENALVAADRAVQPSIDGANVTSGTIAVARMHGDMATDTELAAQDSCAEITGCVESAITATLTQEEVDDYVNALLNDADSVHTGITITYDDANDAYDFEVTATGASQPNIDGANVTSGTIAAARIHTDMATDAELAAQDACSEITGCVENALVAADRAVQPSIHAANVTTGLDAGTDLTVDLEEEVTEGSLADSVILSADIKDDEVTALDLNTQDFGDWACVTGTCTLEADVVAAAEMADADHGDVSWTSGVATVEGAAGDFVAVGHMNVTTADKNVYVGSGGGFIGGNASAIWMEFP